MPFSVESTNAQDIMPLFGVSTPPPCPFQVTMPFQRNEAKPGLTPRFVPRISRLAPDGPPCWEEATLLVIELWNWSRVGLSRPAERMVMTEPPRPKVTLLKNSPVSPAESAPLSVKLPPRRWRL